MSANAVTVSKDKVTGVGTVTLNRPDVLNALDRSLTYALREALAAVGLDPTVRAVVLQGAGGNFMAGGDIRTFAETLKLGATDRQQLFERFIGEVHESIIRIRRMDKPVVASVRGAVAGFGLSLMNSCDLVVAADNSYFTMAYRNIGASPDGSGTYGLPRIVGLKRAMEIALLGERFDAVKALEFGLVNRVVPVDELQTVSQAVALSLAQGPTLALARTKHLLNASLDRTLTEQLLAEQESFAACSLDEDFEIGLQSFIEKRRPVFKGR
ncbi:enoyl-CoA hydratase (plasmid) [Agrobacterium leguminum]|uniref:Enoyl-CoA hydratase/carnithine racemase n=1 Tax=Agrobacterium deltaense NCPPB 1641 TaxID=1183425 RepID=A0A1S7U7A6_9HYPH|nr:MULTISPECIES: enoyl-CoA hydratase [Agrobacterium]WFS69810.1 enoyl-CoA hydratase [Agrobacterium leguminum]CVI62612.1 Enoyl-CoA hydratase/carnithine racemase [Agrobacterium deltaense NCPPB 1641]